MKSNKIDPKNYIELTSEELDKLNANRLFGLRDKMSAIISKIDSDYEYTLFENEEKTIAKESAIIYKNKILHRLAKFGHIEK